MQSLTATTKARHTIVRWPPDSTSSPDRQLPLPPLPSAAAGSLSEPSASTAVLAWCANSSCTPSWTAAPTCRQPRDMQLSHYVEVPRSSSAAAHVQLPAPNPLAAAHASCYPPCAGARGRRAARPQSARQTCRPRPQTPLRWPPAPAGMRQQSPHIQ